MRSWLHRSVFIIKCPWYWLLHVPGLQMVTVAITIFMKQLITTHWQHVHPQATWCISDFENPPSGIKIQWGEFEGSARTWCPRVVYCEIQLILSNCGPSHSLHEAFHCSEISFLLFWNFARNSLWFFLCSFLDRWVTRWISASMLKSGLCCCPGWTNPTLDALSSTCAWSSICLVKDLNAYRAQKDCPVLVCCSRCRLVRLEELKQSFSVFLFLLLYWLSGESLFSRVTDLLQFQSCNVHRYSPEEVTLKENEGNLFHSPLRHLLSCQLLALCHRPGRAPATDAWKWLQRVSARTINSQLKAIFQVKFWPPGS